MNPIDFLKQNGLNPEDFRTQTPVAPLRPVIPCYEMRKKRKPRLRDISIVRAELFDQWFSNGEKELNGLFLPYIMLDIMQIHANEHLTRIDFVHKERYHYNKMMELYHTFNINFFSRLSQEQTNRIIDMMDSFSEYIHN